MKLERVTTPYTDSAIVSVEMLVEVHNDHEFRLREFTMTRADGRVVAYTVEDWEATPILDSRKPDHMNAYQKIRTRLMTEALTELLGEAAARQFLAEPTPDEHGRYAHTFRFEGRLPVTVYFLAARARLQQEDLVTVVAYCVEGQAEVAVTFEELPWQEAMQQFRPLLEQIASAGTTVQ